MVSPRLFIIYKPTIVRWWVSFAVMATYILYTPLAQTQEVLFPGLEGEELANAIRMEYAPTELLSEGPMRDTLYARVFLVDDSVRCIYSGLAKHLPAGVDPSQWLYGTGQEINSMNLEHAWPQSKGADKGPGHRNMHHLYPSRSGINSDRGNDPYGEIDDHLTLKWYRGAQTTGTIPTSDIDAFSEYRNGRFEPRENVKGDIARAMFYFWTIYRDDAVSADPDFFELQREVLCAWHEHDPVDPSERERNQIISTYQGGLTNPFIDDCSLAFRAYCQDLPGCTQVRQSDPDRHDAEIIYDHAASRFLISGALGRTWTVRLVDMAGRLQGVETVEAGMYYTPRISTSGIYFLQARSGPDQLVKKIFLP